jgi:hypothetical protein
MSPDIAHFRSHGVTHSWVNCADLACNHHTLMWAVEMLYHSLIKSGAWETAVMGLNELLEQAEKRPALLLVKLREIRDEIHNEHERAKTFEERGVLLAIYKSVMDYVEAARNFEPGGLERFKETRRQDYCLFLARECARPDGYVDPVMMEAVTSREIEAGRMAPDDELRVRALEALKELRELENTERRRRQKEGRKWWPW